jgi:hypothetical protein
MAQLARADLSQYQVLLLPDRYSPGYAAALGESGVAGLRDWVERGGVLITIAGASQLMADPEAGLMDTRLEYRLEDGEGSDEDDEEADRVPGTALDEASYAEAIAARRASPDSMGGAQLRAEVDPDHWLAAGVAPQLHVLARNSDVYTPLRLKSGVNVASFSGYDDLLAGGHMWELNRRQLAHKPFVMTQRLGRGHLIAFTQDPTVRAYQDGLNVIVANAIFRAAAHARPLR